jgi:hypothetical protein
MSNINLPPDIEFHADIRLLVYRPRGVIDEAAVSKIIRVFQDREEAEQWLGVPVELLAPKASTGKDLDKITNGGSSNG